MTLIPKWYRRIVRCYPLTLLVLVAVTTLCLMPINDPPLKDVPLIDKWTHMVLFGGICMVMFVELSLNRCRQLWLSLVCAALYGGLIELMQKYLTTCRSGEWMDFVADAIGAAIVYVIVRLIVRFL